MADVESCDFAEDHKYKQEYSWACLNNYRHEVI